MLNGKIFFLSRYFSLNFLFILTILAKVTKAAPRLADFKTERSLIQNTSLESSNKLNYTINQADQSKQNFINARYFLTRFWTKFF